jgi:hypothetical protein
MRWHACVVAMVLVVMAAGGCRGSSERPFGAARKVVADADRAEAYRTRGNP